MPRQRKGKGVSIVLQKGKTYVYGPGVDVVLKDRAWLVRINPTGKSCLLGEGVSDGRISPMRPFRLMSTAEGVST